MKRWISIIMIIWGCSGSVFGLTMSANQQAFINKVVSAVGTANANVDKSRSKLLSLYDQYVHQKKISEENIKWLAATSEQYKVPSHDFSNSTTWQQLLMRVDEIPPSLVLAQAINESAWGQSRFAKEANNYFGKYCYVKGCGIIPLHREPNSIHEVKKYPSLQASVNDYMLNLNSHDAYKSLRQLRQQARVNHQVLNGSQLTPGLKRYSTKGQEYIRMLNGIIAKFNLKNYDTLSA